MRVEGQYFLTRIELDEKSVIHRSAQIEHERKIAIFDLLEENYFEPVQDIRGPYTLYLSVSENRIIFDVRSDDDSRITMFSLAIVIFRKIVKDYFLICESYFEAIKTGAPSKIEAIDMGRRGLHNDGAHLLKEQLEKFVKVDMSTARRLFTLICVLHIRV